jgi:hypothetical protein
MILGQMKLEDCVARLPEPVVTLKTFDGGVNVDVRYNDAVSGTAEFKFRYYEVIRGAKY